MSVEYDKAFVQQFSDNLIILAQQRGSKLAGVVKQERVKAKSHHFDRLGATVAQKKVSRHSDTPLIDTPHSRRRVTMDDYEWADLIDTNDKVRALINPTSEYAMAGAWAIGRSIDDVIISAATGNSVAVDASDATSNVAMLAGNIIDNDFGGADSNLTAVKVMEARRILRGHEIDMDEEMFLVANSFMISGLMQDADVKDFDFNTSKPMAAGELSTYGGFRIIHSERILGAGVADTDPYIGLAFTRSALGLALGQDINVRISERPDKSYSTQVFASATFGATRIEEEKIVSIECS
jgi:hypothetical protein